MLFIPHNFLVSFSYKLLHVLEFDSTRKRMSVIVSESDGESYGVLFLFTIYETHMYVQCSY
jgi:magnesium-transporting ATPase (P-type)